LTQFLNQKGEVVGHPGWLIGDDPQSSRKLTDDELVALGYGLKIVDVPFEYDPKTQVVSTDPIESWEKTDTTAYRSHTVTTLTKQELRDRLPRLTPRQLRLALLSVGITETQVDAALESNPAGLIEWKYASDYNRAHPLITQLAPAFSLTETQVDQLWAVAATL
jgi:hypothetical protein